MNDARSISLKISSNFRVLLFSLLLLPVPAQASDTGGDIEVAVALYKKGYAHFRQQRYPDALSAFLRSREALPRSRRYQRARNELLYYIGACYMEIGSDRKARQYLKDYLVASPRKRDKDKDVSVRLALLEKRLALPKPPPPPSRVIIRRPPPPPPPPPPHLGGWITFGIGGGTLIGGLIVAILAQQKMDETTQRYEQQKQSASRIAQDVTLSFRSAQERATTANILYAVGGAAAITGVLLLFLWKAPPSTPTPPPPSAEK